MGAGDGKGVIGLVLSCPAAGTKDLPSGCVAPLQLELVPIGR